MRPENIIATKVSSGGAVGDWLFLITFTLVFYGMGASFVESFVNYPTWKLIGEGEFKAFHNALSPLIIGYMVIPVFAAIFLTGSLVWKRPWVIPAWMVIVALVMQLIAAVSTFAIQIPIQIELSSRGLSPNLIDRLISTNFWFRRIPMFVNSILFFWMMARVLRLRKA